MSPDSPISPTGQESHGLICEWLGCGRNFESLDELVSHLTTSHVSSQHGSFYCLWRGCTRDKGFNARYKMLIHIRTHTNERPYVCPQCDKRFSRQENLRIHARTHTGEKPYVCTIMGCGKAYSNSSDRFKHTRTHFVDKPYECRFPGCSKRYTDPSSLRKHVKIYGHGKKADDPSASSSCSVPAQADSLDTSMVAARMDLSPSPSLDSSPMSIGPSPSLLSSPFFPNVSSAAAVTAASLAHWSPVSAAAAWTVALQQYQAGLLLRSGTNLQALRPMENLSESKETDLHGSSALDLTMCSSPLDLSISSSSRMKKT